MSMHSLRTVAITGANSGLGKELAHRLALRADVVGIYLLCRDARKAANAVQDLETRTGRTIFRYVEFDSTDLSEARRIALSLPEPVDGLVMNAGGLGGATPHTLTAYGATSIMASNLLGHAVLLESLLSQRKLRTVAVMSGSEAARGSDFFGMPRPRILGSSVDEVVSVIDGRFLDGRKLLDYLNPYSYAHTKYIATLWMSAMARRHQEVRLLTVSPGTTTGTGVAENMSMIPRWAYQSVFQGVLNRVLPPSMKLAHALEDGVQRYLDALYDARLRSGLFYASPANRFTGPLTDQSGVFPALMNVDYQENAYRAVTRITLAALRTGESA
jgi:NAD(P)-dependent dehydrogenase (short-subunit alcohol dehydrogenase family)